METRRDGHVPARARYSNVQSGVVATGTAAMPPVMGVPGVRVLVAKLRGRW